MVYSVIMPFSFRNSYDTKNSNELKINNTDVTVNDGVGGIFNPVNYSFDDLTNY